VRVELPAGGRRPGSPPLKPWLAGRHPVLQGASLGLGRPYESPAPRPGPQGPVRPRGARCRPSRDAATAFIPGRRPWAAAERAVSPQAKVALRPAGIEPLGGALPASDPAGAPVDRAGSLDHAHALEQVPSLDPRGTEGGLFSVERWPLRIGPAGEPPGTAPGRGGGTWRLPVMRSVRRTASILRTQLPASVAFGSVLPTHGPCGEPLHGEPLHGNRRVASSETHRKSSADVRHRRSARRTYRIGPTLQNRPDHL
jgi:hypothetical protein